MDTTSYLSSAIQGPVHHESQMVIRSLLSRPALRTLVLLWSAQQRCCNSRSKSSSGEMVSGG